MTRAEINEKLKEVIGLTMGDGEVNLDKCTEESSLTGDLGLNSVGILYVVVAIEEFFGIIFDDVGFGDFKTVGNVVDYIERKIN